MSLTYSIDHASTSVEDVSVEIPEKSTMLLSGVTIDSKTGEIVSSYTIPSGDNSYPATVVYRCVLQKRSTGNVRRISMTFSTWATMADSVSGLDTKKAISGTISFLVPADMTIEVADMDDFIGNLFGFLYLSVTAKARDTTWLAKLLFGISQVK